MIETTRVEGPTNGFSAGPASPNICGLTATTRVATSRVSFVDGLRRMPFAASAPISAEGCGSITATRFGSSPPASHPVSIAPPVLPAPASTMVPVMFCNALADDIG